MAGRCGTLAFAISLRWLLCSTATCICSRYCECHRIGSGGCIRMTDIRVVREEYCILWWTITEIPYPFVDKTKGRWRNRRKIGETFIDTVLLDAIRRNERFQTAHQVLRYGFVFRTVAGNGNKLGADFFRLPRAHSSVYSKLPRLVWCSHNNAFLSRCAADRNRLSA